MANNIDTRAAIQGRARGEQFAGQRKGGWPRQVVGLAAAATAGLALLAGVVLGQAHPAAQPAAQPGTRNPAVNETQFVADQFTYREDHRTAAASFTPDQFTYREDHRAEARSVFTPDFWTYREDHRGETGAAGR